MSCYLQLLSLNSLEVDKWKQLHLCCITASLLYISLAKMKRCVLCCCIIVIIIVTIRVLILSMQRNWSLCVTIVEISKMVFSSRLEVDISFLMSNPRMSDGRLLLS